MALLKFNDFVCESIDNTDLTLFNKILSVANSLSKKGLNGFRLDKYYYLENHSHDGYEFNFVFKKTDTYDFKDYTYIFTFDITSDKEDINFSFSKTTNPIGSTTYRTIDNGGLRYGKPDNLFKSTKSNIDKKEFKEFFQNILNK